MHYKEWATRNNTQQFAKNLEKMASWDKRVNRETSSSPSKNHCW